MLFTLFLDFKNVLASTLHLSRDALHVHIGLIIFFVGAALLRGPRRFEIAFVGLFVLCVTGELIDAATAWHNVRGPNWLGGAKDIVNTMFWPGIWLLGWQHVLRMLHAEGPPPRAPVAHPRAGEGAG
jgi:hypothetical protein